MRSDDCAEGFYSRRDYPEKLRRIRFFDAEKDKRIILLTQQLLPASFDHRPALPVSWQVELFFKWIKQHLRIKAFLWNIRERGQDPDIGSPSPSTSLLPSSKAPESEASLYTILQILSVSLFEKIPISQALSLTDYREPEVVSVTS